MKKILSVISAAAVILTMAGCSSKATLNTADGGIGGAAAEHGASTAAPSSPTGGSTAGAGSESLTAAGSDGGLSSGAPATSAAATAAMTTIADLSRDGAFSYDAEADKIGVDTYADPSLGGEMFADIDAAAAEAPYDSIIDYDPIIDIDLPEQPAPQAGLLTGGEWNDNDHWHDWVSLYQREDYWRAYDDEWGYSLDFRYEVKVTSGGRPVEGAKVTCDYAFAPAVTDNTGTAYLFFDDKDMTKEPLTVTASYGDVSATSEQLVQKDSTVEIDLEGVSPKTDKKLDLMIVCDTTGSMFDELEYLQKELISILNSVERNNANIPTRVSVNFYRDDGDEYVVRDFPFTTDFSEAEKQMSEQWADGGGDFPEAVDKALANALEQHDWDEDAVKLMFIVLDAPPHSEDPQVVSYMHRLTALASEMGVRIIPVASSGVDKTTEFLLRTIAFTTGGTYTFLTDDSGVSVGGHIVPTIGEYTVEKLNDMIVRIVGEYLA